MPLEIPIPKVEAPKVSVAGTLPKFSTTSTVSVNNSGFSKPSSGNLVNVSSLSSNGIKTSIAPPLDIKNIKPSITLNGSVNVSGATLKALTTKAGVTATIGAAAAAMNIPIGLPNTTDALKTLGVPTDLKSLQALTGLQLPKFPLFPGIDLPGLLLGKSPKFIAEVIMKYKTISPPFLPGVKMNMAVILAAAAVIKAAASGKGGELLKHLLEGITNEIKGELIKSLQASIDSTGINKVGQQIGEAINNATNIQVQTSMKFKPKQLDEDGNEIEEPEEEVEKDDTFGDFGDEFEMEEDKTKYESEQESDDNIGEFSEDFSDEQSVSQNEQNDDFEISDEEAITEMNSQENVSSNSVTQASAPVPTPVPTEMAPTPQPTTYPGGLSKENFNKLRKYSRLEKKQIHLNVGGMYSSSSSNPTRAKYIAAANSLDKYTWIYPFEEGWSQDKIDAWTQGSDPYIW